MIELNEQMEPEYDYLRWSIIERVEGRRELPYYDSKRLVTIGGLGGARDVVSLSTKELIPKLRLALKDGFSPSGRNAYSGP